MDQATLWTSRIELVPLSAEHLEHEVELDSDPEVMRYLGAGRARTREEVEALHEQRIAAGKLVPGLGFWAGFVDGEFVGWWILEPPSRASSGSTSSSTASSEPAGLRPGSGRSENDRQEAPPH